MLGSILVPSSLQTHSHSHSTKPASSTRRSTVSGTVAAPSLPPRRHGLSTTPAAQTASLQAHAQTVSLQTTHTASLKSVTLSGGMDSRYHRSTSPRRAYNPARSSTGTFADPYAASYNDYASYRPSSPRSSADRLPTAASHHRPTSSYAGYATGAPKYDSGYGSTRPRRNTGDLGRPAVASLASLPLRTPYTTTDLRPSSPLAPSRPQHGLADTYITHGSSRQDTSRQDTSRQDTTSSHKKIYSVDSSHTAKLVAETDTIESPRRTTTASKPSSRYTHTHAHAHAHADLGDNGYSYTDPASMYRDTEPAWRRPRAGSVERGSRPSSMIVDRPPRTSTRDLGPPPSTRGFDKINTPYPRPARSSSIERRDRYQDPYASDSAPHRSSSTRHAAAPALPSLHQGPALHQEPRRAETYDDYTRGRDVEPTRHSTYDASKNAEPRHSTYDASKIADPRHTYDASKNADPRHTYDRFEDREVVARGFGIAPPNTALEHTPSAYHSDRGAESRRPERPVSTYDSYDPPRVDRPRTEHKRDNSRDTRDTRDARDSRDPRDTRDTRDARDTRESRAIPVAAGALAGMSAAAGIAAVHGKAKEKEREERGSSEERERQKRREYDERDRRDDRYDDRERRDDRRRPEERRDPERRDPDRREALPPPPPPAQQPFAQPYAPPAAAPVPAYAKGSEPERPMSRDRPYPNEENPPPKPPRKASPEGSDVERPRHYADRESDRSRKEPAPPPAAVDPDEEYRRLIAQAEKEAEASRRAAADRQDSDSDGGRDRRRRRDRADRERSRSRSRGREDRRDRSPSQALARFNDRDLVEEPESVDKLNPDAPGKSVQIVVPRKDQSPPLKGILRKPTAKFPEDPEPIREGVAPHKDAQKGKDIPIGARWTRIDRKLVNPEALERAKERFEERMDCVIVLRVLTKDEIQKLADKTKQIREEREEEYERERRDRDRSRHRSRKDDDDGRDREYDRDYERERRRRRDEESDYDETRSERDRERDRPKMLEPAR